MALQLQLPSQKKNTKKWSAVQPQEVIVVILLIGLYALFREQLFLGRFFSDTFSSVFSSQDPTSAVSADSTMFDVHSPHFKAFLQEVSKLETMLLQHISEDNKEVVKELKELELGVLKHLEMQRERTVRLRVYAEHVRLLEKMKANGTLDSYHQNLLANSQRARQTVEELVSTQRTEQRKVFRNELAYPIRTELTNGLTSKTSSFCEHRPNELGETVIDYEVRQYGSMPLCLPFTSLSLAVGVVVVLEPEHNRTSTLAEAKLKQSLEHAASQLSKQSYTDWTLYLAVFPLDRFRLSFVLDDSVLQKMAESVFGKRVKAKVIDLKDERGIAVSEAVVNAKDAWAMAISSTMDWAQEDLKDVFVLLPEEGSSTQLLKWSSESHLQTIMSSHYKYPDAGILYLSTLMEDGVTLIPNEYDRNAYDRRPWFFVNTPPILTSMSFRLDRLALRFRTSFEAQQQQQQEQQQQQPHDQLSNRQA
eukprot:TRINITY_DN2595_c0_g4_i1.p1 TRINITY_DN2595_c0_g4~~TRINITY_DN2595_c0_g4_i1.p1  ORF type:complete len:476 (+),score=105.37 TRINITY_DN2595_c0_g4_i1:243-1670(+)